MVNDTVTFVSPDIKTSGETRFPAISDYNRKPSESNFKPLVENIKAKGYRDEMPIHVIKAEVASEHGVGKLYDIHNEEIPKEDYEKYFLVLLGTLRVSAVAIVNQSREKEKKKLLEIPAVEVPLKEEEMVSEYMSEMNSTQVEVQKTHYLKIAKNVHPDHPLLNRYCELIATKDNKDGISLSTLNQIFCNARSITKKDLVLLAMGKTKKGKSAKDDIIPSYDLELGDKFLDICENHIGFTKSDIKKRYLIKEFNKMRNSGGKEKMAIEIFHAIENEDIKAMRNKNGNLDEQLVIDHFDKMKHRYEESKQVDQAA